MGELHVEPRACPTCSATMASIGYCNGGTIYHCERCGTVMHSGEFIDPPKVYVPKLVERCRRFEGECSSERVAANPLIASSWVMHLWNRLGVVEAIRPAEREEGRQRKEKPGGEPPGQ